MHTFRFRDSCGILAYGLVEVTALGQIPKKAPKVPLSFRAVPEQVAALDDVVKAEGSEDVGRSEVLEYLISLALPLYWAREDVGHERIDRVVDEHGGNARRAYAELLTLGLIAKELDPNLLKSAIAERNRRAHGLRPIALLVSTDAEFAAARQMFEEAKAAAKTVGIEMEAAGISSYTDTTSGSGQERTSRPAGVPPPKGGVTDPAKAVERAREKELRQRAWEWHERGFPLADIAKEMGLSEAQVKKLMKGGHLKPSNG
jgi:nucleoside phosphorylase